ncbi:hypothetical protein K8R14_04285 [bacterium]|nr:hypothetical protein [bacterium]
MKSLIGYLRKAIWISSFLFLFVSLNSNSVLAQTGISTSSTFSHTVKTNGYVDTTTTLTITSDERVVLTYYTITLLQDNIEPKVFSITENKSLEATVYDRNSATDILIDLDNAIVSPDSPQKIRITYSYPYDDTNILSLKSKVADTNTSEVSITYPKSLGEIEWISDQAESIKQDNTHYILNIQSPDSSTIKLIFNQGIVYRFDISKSFNNQGDSATQYELLIPQDSQFQKIIIEEMSVQPTQVIQDNNFNYLLVFTVDAQTQMDVKISGYVIMEHHNYYPTPDSVYYDSTSIYWSLENKQIEKVEQYLKENGIATDSVKKDTLIKYLYRYTIETLTPSTHSTSLSGGIRKGSVEILKNPINCTPEDYTDILKSLFDYYQIPSIYTIGYVSDISSYQEDGMFHYWVQSFDGNQWLTLDPYLEDYSKVSLFGREHSDHISILNRIYEPISPTLPYYSDNDIRFEYVNDSDVVYSPQSNLSINLEPYSILNKYIHGSIFIENVGNTILTGIDFTDSTPDINQYIDYVSNSTSSILLPHMQKYINFHIPFEDLEQSFIFTTANVKNGEETIQSELLSTNYSITQHTGYEILIQVISALSFLTFLGAVYLFLNKVVYKR